MLITGATGSDGRELLTQLSGLGVALRAMVRTPSDQEREFLQGAELAKADFDDADRI